MLYKVNLLESQKIQIDTEWLFSQEFGQSTPEIRKSARKIPSLFKKRKLEKEMSTNPEKKTVQRSNKKINGISKDDDSDDSATGEYVEVQ